MHLLHELADDALFGGVEGGATSTTAALLDAEGRLLGSATAAGSNGYLASEDATAALLLRVLAEARAAAGVPAGRRLTALGMGMSGFNEPARQQALFTALRRADARDTAQQQRRSGGGGAPCLALHPSCRLCAFNDSVGALHAAAPPAQGGVVLIAGTGSFAQLTLPEWATEPGGGGGGGGGAGGGGGGGASSARCGGWGHLVGDEGSAAAISLHALRRIFDAVDGFAVGQATAAGAELTAEAAVVAAAGYTPPRCLLQGEPVPPYAAAAALAMKAHFGVSRREDLLPLLYPPPNGGAAGFDKARIAGFAEPLAVLARQGDPLCRVLLDEAGAALGAMLRALAKRLPPPPPPPPPPSPAAAGAAAPEPWRLRVLCVGSVWKSWDLLKDGFLRGYGGGGGGVGGGAALPAFALLRLSTGTACAAGAALVAAARALGVELPVDREAQVATLYRSQLLPPLSALEAAPEEAGGGREKRRGSGDGAPPTVARRAARALGVGLVAAAGATAVAVLALRQQRGMGARDALALVLAEATSAAGVARSAVEAAVARWRPASGPATDAQAQ